MTRLLPSMKFMALVLLAAAFAAAAHGQELLYRQHGTLTDSLGSGLAGIGDLDGDQVRDFLVSAPGDHAGLGTVRVHSGATGVELMAIVGPPSGGAGAPASFGAALSSAGDVDGDGLEDILVGAWGEDGGQIDSGSATVYSGANHELLHRLVGGTGSAFLGTAVSALSDLDGDGRDDFVVGAPGDLNASGLAAGSVSVFSGATGGVLYRLEGASVGEKFGSAVAAMPDVNGDGVPELLVGAPEVPPPGAVHVFSGASGTLLYQVIGKIFDSRFGRSVAGLEDLDGDGKGDFLVGAPYAVPAGTGYAQVWSGATGTALRLFAGAGARDAFGSSVAGVGDVNGDGVEDFLVGANESDIRSPRIGYARLYSGRTLELLYEFEGQDSPEEFGSTVAGLGDLDGDGLAEFAISAPNAGPRTEPGGYFAVYRGNDLFLNLSSNQAAPGDLLIRTTGEGVPLGAVAEFITSVNGAPSLHLIQFGRLDAEGRRASVEAVPPGLSGVTITLRAYARGASGGVIDSADEILVIQ